MEYLTRRKDETGTAPITVDVLLYRMNGREKVSGGGGESWSRDVRTDKTRGLKRVKRDKKGKTTVHESSVTGHDTYGIRT